MLALEALDDLRLCHVFVCAPSHVGLRRLIGDETRDDDAPQRAVGVVVAAVEAMTTAGLSGGRRLLCAS
jgi:hypothetical protein